MRNVARMRPNAVNQGASKSIRDVAARESGSSLLLISGIDRNCVIIGNNQIPNATHHSPGEKV